MLIYYILNLLSNTRSRNDTYGTIARQLSRNISKLDDYSLTALAEICSVSPASLSRFTRLMDYRNYSTLANQLQEAIPDYVHGDGQLLIKSPLPHEKGQTAMRRQLDQMNELAYQAVQTIDLTEAARCLIQASKVAVFGSPKPQAALMLQMELGMQGIECTNYYAPEDQYPEMQALEAGCTAVVYDCYDHDSILPYILSLRKPDVNLILISCSEKLKATYNPDFFLAYPNLNFAMNLALADQITLYLVSELQAAAAAEAR
ncbi:hypothetical protein [Holdemania filiformis]|uniref:hypothetical protein n=1 Tax=Holdemania filiformis TaxID=61171 RepID=UPI00242EC0A8|nr:hypothetical protein [Holdemania filiformis]